MTTTTVMLRAFCDAVEQRNGKAFAELFTTAASLNSARDAGRDSSVLSKCSCNTLRIAVYKSFSVTVAFVHYAGRLTR